MQTVIPAISHLQGSHDQHGAPRYPMTPTLPLNTSGRVLHLGEMDISITKYLTQEYSNVFLQLSSSSSRYDLVTE